MGEHGMSMRISPLSETEIESALPCDKPIKMFDGAGLFLQIETSGRKLWRYKYRFEGKEKLLSFGKYPDVSLSDARLMRAEARLLLDKGIDPSSERKKETSIHGAAEVKPSVRAVMDGTIEIWKGRSVLRFTQEEATFVNELLNKLL